MTDLDFAVIGCGFWSQYQIAAWQELAGARLVAVCDRDPAKAEAAAQRFGVPRIYADAETMFRDERLDFVDIITDVGSHAEFARLAAWHGTAAITQKPMAPNLETARQMIQAARDAGARLLVHENFRWQAPLRRVKIILTDNAIGTVFRARLTFNSAFPVFDNQPPLAELEQFILTDIGAHVLDVARFLFGEVQTVYCRTRRVNPAIRGEDVASVLLQMANGVHCYVELSYASRLERESFPQTLALIEGQNGTVRLGLDGEIVLVTQAGITRETVTPHAYSWADPAYAVAHSSLVDCHQNLLADLRGAGRAETTAEDNFQTLRLVFACYDSARENRVIFLDGEETIS